MPTKILLVTARADHGGSSRHIVDLIESFKHSDFVFYVAAPEQKPYSEKFRKLGKGYFELPVRSFSLRAFFRLRDFITANGIDIVHSHGRGGGIYARLLKVFGSKLPTLHTFHGIHRETTFMGRLKLWLDRALSFTEFTPIFVSDYEKREGYFFGCVRPDRNGVVITNPVDTNRFTANRIHSEVKTIGTFMRDDFVKGPDLLLKNARRSPEFLWSCVGTSNLERWGDVPPCLDLKGPIEEPATWLQSLDVYVSFSRNEAMPLGVLEAMSAGCVCVLSDIEAHRTFAKDGAALLFDPQMDSGPAALSEILARLKNESALRSSLRTQCQKLVAEKHSVRKFQNALSALYESAIKN